MSLDLPDQLREYGDHFRSGLPTVEIEDIFASRTAVASLEVATATPPWKRVWVLIAGFVATIVVVGGSLGIGLLLETESDAVGITDLPTAGAGDGGGGIWALVIAVGAALLLALGVIAVRGRTEIVKTNGGVMQTLERREVEVSPRPRSPAILIAALLVVAAGAMGWWLGSNDAAVDIPEIVNQWTNAWVDDDPDAVAALYTDDGIYIDKNLEAPALYQVASLTGRDAMRSHVGTGMYYADFDVMRVDNVIVLDLIVFEWTASGMSFNTVHEDMTPFETTGVTVFEMEDGLIARSFNYYNNGELFN